MKGIWEKVLWSQFGATIDMFANALRACPDDLWTATMWKDPAAEAGFSEFWYIAYHTLFWLDLYLTGSVEDFSPPAPYNLDELDPSGVLPARIYTRDELLTYLEHCRQKCHSTIEKLTYEEVHRKCTFTWSLDGLSFAELLIDNMRHVQEHGAQLNMFLGQQSGISSGWVAMARGEK
jgi:hypothetical protein